MMRRNKEDKFPGKLLKWKKKSEEAPLYQVWQPLRRLTRSMERGTVRRRCRARPPQES